MIEMAEAAQTVELRVMILAGPILAERLKIPGLVGLIFLGMVLMVRKRIRVKSDGDPVFGPSDYSSGPRPVR